MGNMNKSKDGGAPCQDKSIRHTHTHTHKTTMGNFQYYSTPLCFVNVHRKQVWHAINQFIKRKTPKISPLFASRELGGGNNQINCRVCPCTHTQTHTHPTGQVIWKQNPQLLNEANQKHSSDPAGSPLVKHSFFFCSSIPAWALVADLKRMAV